MHLQIHSSGKGLQGGPIHTMILAYLRPLLASFTLTEICCLILRRGYAWVLTCVGEIGCPTYLVMPCPAQVIHSCHCTHRLHNP